MGLFDNLFQVSTQKKIEAETDPSKKLAIIDKALAGGGSMFSDVKSSLKAQRTMFQATVDAQKSITAEKLALEKETKKLLAAPELSSGRSRLLDRTRGGFMSTILGGQSFLGG